MRVILTVLSIVAIYLSVNVFTTSNNPFVLAQQKIDAVEAAVAPIPVQADWPTQIKDSLVRNGFTPEQARIMLAIAKGESGWRLDAVGDTTITTSKWGPSVGVFQIRTLKTPQKGCRDREKLWNNLDAQASCAYLIYKSQGYRAWTIYLNGSYKKYL